MSNSRFAIVEDLKTEEFRDIISDMCRLHRSYGLPDHYDVNRIRYPWADNMQFRPEVYAARLWEYPFGIISSDIQPGMLCADIGCGMSAFTLYLKEKCTVIGVDPDLFEKGIKNLGTGVNKEYIKQTGLNIVRNTLDFQDGTFDRVFSISVIEHVPRRITPSLMREMSRILKPGGLMIITVDVNINYDMARPLDLIWQSGLIPKGNLDIAWPTQRFGRADDPRYPADVFGMVLEKPTERINADFGSNAVTINQSQIPYLRYISEKHVSLPVKVRRYIKANFTGR